jgi:hypothetical protein
MLQIAARSIVIELRAARFGTQKIVGETVTDRSTNRSEVIEKRQDW